MTRSRRSSITPPATTNVFQKALAVVGIAALAVQNVVAQELSDDTVSRVRDRLAEAAQRSWELGTRAQALLEHDAPDFSVFTAGSLPPPSVPSDPPSGLSAVFSIASDIIEDREDESGNQPLMEDGSAADPASNGVAVLLYAWTNQSNADDFEDAAQEQLDYLLLEVPRTDDGAISHRVSEVSLWSDYVYMVPPFLAYYGVMNGNRTMLDEAINQCRLYRNYLRDEDANNLWMHIVEGRQFDDPGHWSTGNGWAAMGMLRVIATIQNSQFDFDYRSQNDELVGYVEEILDAMWDVVDDTHIFRNYADNESTFYDAASTALLAASTYRLSLTSDSHSNIPAAERARRALADPDNDHFTDDGWLQPVVNPHSFGAEGNNSAEGQAFVLMMQAAWQEWVDAGSVGSGAVVVRPLARVLVMVVVGVLTVVLS